MLALLSAPFYIGAALCLCLGWWCTLVGTALARMTRTEAASGQEEGKKGSTQVVRILARRPAATMGLSTLRSLFMSSYGMLLLLGLLTDLTSWWLIFLAFFGVTAVVMLAFAFLNPLDYAQRHHLRIIYGSRWWLSGVTSLFSILVRQKEFTAEEFEQRQEDQLAVMVERVSESEAIEDSERNILESLFDMSNTMVREVMVPRTDMVAIAHDQSLDKALSLFTRSGFSRVPVYQETVDDIIGVVYMKDVIRRVHHRHDTAGVTVEDVCREPFFVPEMKMIDTLLPEMQNEQVHIALVVDEYGGIAGLVTIEDLVEELVGEIEDEHDHSTPEIEDLGDGTYRVAARTSITDLGELFGVELVDDDVDTVAGLFAKILGRVPIRDAEGEVAGIHLVADRFEGRRHHLSTVLASRATPVANSTA
ncbi:hemolysin family protein [Actinobaculum suis]|uniref:hemolysin family protein n=1 Tax=Actinobaculum suis TaxID=1657 RepID=UPI00080A5A0C|nr:hemolysin family protein [Actinobaculum suis]OCA93814.1 magnesium/cobalt efflux protein [Actinobaculum suis]